MAGRARSARNYEQRLAEAPDDAVLDTLRQTLAAYEAEIRAISRDRLPMYAFPDRLALPARVAGAFKPADRGDLGDLMAQLIDDFEAYKQETERRIENASHGCLPSGLEDALYLLANCMELLWSACEHEASRSAIDYLVA